MKQCRCVGLTEQLEQEVVDELSMWAGEEPMTYSMLHRAATDDTVWKVSMLARLREQPVQETWSTIAAILHIVPPAIEMRARQDELVPASELWPDPALQLVQT